MWLAYILKNSSIEFDEYLRIFLLEMSDKLRELIV